MGVKLFFRFLVRRMFQLLGTVGIVIMVFLTIEAKIATAIPIIVHQGSTDPTTEGWTLNNGSSGTIAGGTETTASGTHDFWQIDDTETSLGSVPHYTYIPSVADLSGDWFFEASVRLVNAPPIPGTVNIGPHAVYVADGVNYWSFYMSDDLVGPLSNSEPHSLLPPPIPLSFVDYHTFAIQFLQNDPGIIDDTADFFIDGTLVFDDVGRSDLFASSHNFIWFGAIGSASIGKANYEYVSFDNGEPIPEPTTIALLGIGLAGLAGVGARRKMKKKAVDKG